MDQRLKDMLDRQAAWQRSRSRVSWEEKLRMSLVMREAQLMLRENARTKNQEASHPGEEPDR